MSFPAYIKEAELPYGWSEDARHFINKLLVRKAERRLGFNGDLEVKQHKWLKNFPWDELLSKTINSPFVPKKKDNFDKTHCDECDKVGIETKMRYKEYKTDLRYPNLFVNFTFYRDESKIRSVKKEAKDAKSTITTQRSLKEAFDSNLSKSLSFVQKISQSNSPLVSACSRRLKQFSPRSLANKNIDNNSISAQREYIVSSLMIKKKNYFKMNKTLSVLSRSAESFRKDYSPNENRSKNVEEKSSYVYKKKKINDNYFGSVKKGPKELLKVEPINQRFPMNRLELYKKGFNCDNSGENLLAEKNYRKKNIKQCSPCSSSRIKENKVLYKSNSMSFIFKNYKMSSNTMISTKSTMQSSNRLVK